VRRVVAITLLFVLIGGSGSAQDIKNVDLAGSWYPAQASKLSAQIKEYLKKATPPPIKGEVVALISPHAGIIYSGGVAAYGFKSVQNQSVDTVVVVGFSHHNDYNGIAVFDKDGIRTPLGVLYSDTALVKKLVAQDDKLFPYHDAFLKENSVELILPFIQVALGNPKVVLLAIGRQSLENCTITGEALYEVLKGKDNVLIVASTDLSHYLPEEQAKRIDAHTAELIVGMDAEKVYKECAGKNRMCGNGAVVATMIAAKKLGANSVHILKMSTSAATSKDKSRVVGYLSAAFVKEKKEVKESETMGNLLNDQEKKELLKLARDTITTYITKGEILEVKEDDPVLSQPMGAFVTLRKAHQLRGCIGNLVGTKPLFITIRDMAIAAATEDPRFPRLSEEELPSITIEISVLSPLEKVSDPDAITLGRDGVLVKQGFRSGVYLPQVATETGWNKEQFLTSLCAHKAGIAPDAWKKGECELYIFTAEVFQE
jgi:AmmeMemoRadiSam system protein B/AmmeMemoRadiSam system protein A